MSKAFGDDADFRNETYALKFIDDYFMSFISRKVVFSTAFTFSDIEAFITVRAPMFVYIILPHKLSPINHNSLRKGIFPRFKSFREGPFSLQRRLFIKHQ